jgi:hypothetical protein
MNQHVFITKKQFLLITWLFVILSISSVQAMIPAQIHFQGMLTDSEGKIVAKDQHVIIFSIWDKQSPSSESTPLWKERHLVTVENGVYSVLLGSHVLFADPDQDPSTDDALSFADPYFLDIQYKDRSLTSKGKLFPLTTVWNAFRAKTSEGRLVTHVKNDHIIQASDDIVFAQNGSQITLPKASNNKGRQISIKKSDNINKGLSIRCQANDQIIASQTSHAASAAITLTHAYEEISLVSDGNIWWGMGQNYISMDQLDLTDQIESNEIKNGSITTIDIAPDAGIAYKQLSLLESIKGSDIVQGEIKASHIHAQSISNVHIADSAQIAYSKLELNGHIGQADLKPESVDSKIIKDGSLKDSDIAEDAHIQYQKLNLMHAIQNTDLTPDSVDSETIKDGSVVDSDIAEDAQIQYQKLNLVRAIQHSDLKANTVDSEIIQNKTIRDIDIANNARIQYNKLKLTDSIRTIDIQDQTITPSKMNHLHSMGLKNQALTSDGRGGFQWKHMNVLDHVYVVGAGSVFETISDAIAEAKKHQDPVLIKVGPGVYNEQVVTRFKTCIEGAGQGLTIIRFHGGEQGTSSSATVVGYSDVELRNLTIISDASTTKLPNAIGLYNLSSVLLKNLTIKVLGGTAYNYGIYNDRCLPVINDVNVRVRSTVTEESWNYGIYNEYADAHIENVNIQAWGGDRTFGLANKSSFPVIFHTHVTASAGVMKNRGIWNESSSPKIFYSEVIVSGVCHDNYGIENYNNSSPIIKDSLIKAVGLTSYGLYQWGSSQDAIRIYSSSMSGETNSIYGNNAQFLIVNSQLEGSISAQVRCISSFDRDFFPLDQNCLPSH